MFPFLKAFLSLVFITALSVAHPHPLTSRRDKTLSTLAIKPRLNSDQGSVSFVEHARLRARSIQGRGGSDGSKTTVNQVFYYTAEVLVGDEQESFTLVADSGSSISWVGGNRTYVPTKSSENLEIGFDIIYGQGNVTADLWSDTLSVAGLTVSHQSFGVANKTSDLPGIDGTLALGTDAFARIKMQNGTEIAVPTVLDTMHSQGKISERMFGVYFTPACVPNSGGELTFGGYDSSVLASTVNFFPVTTSSPASQYWGAGLSEAAYGSETLLLNSTVVFDFGTTITLLASDAFEKYQNATGAVYDQETGLYTITKEQYEDLQPLKFSVGGEEYTLSPNAQVWPACVDSIIGNDTTAIYLNIGNMDEQSVGGIGVVAGLAFLERYYSVYDAAHSRIGLAQTKYTDLWFN